MCRTRRAFTLTRENNRLGILLHGGRFPGRYPYPEGRCEYADIKGLVEHLLLALGIGAASFERGSEHPIWRRRSRCWRATRSWDGSERSREDLADAYQARGEVWFADLDLDLLMNLRVSQAFRQIPKFPVVRCDMTLIAPQGLAIGSVVDTVNALREPLLEDVFLVDVYTPEGSSERNLSFRFVSRHPERNAEGQGSGKNQSSDWSASGREVACPLFLTGSRGQEEACSSPSPLLLEALAHWTGCPATWRGALRGEVLGRGVPAVDRRQSSKGQRYYTDEHVRVLEQIKHLLYVEKLTIKGARQKMEGAETVRAPMDEIRRELEEIRRMLVEKLTWKQIGFLAKRRPCGRSLHEISDTIAFSR